MASRHGSIAPDGEGYPQPAIEAEATATATVIAGLRERLQRQETLEHPLVLGELHRLEEQVYTQLAYSDQNQGRHRAAGGTAISQQPSDASGSGLKPNPGAATTPAEFIEALWRYKAWSGAPSWRRMATRAGQQIVHSTMYAAMNGEVLPKFEVVRAIIIGCGGSEEDLDSFTRAWRQIMTRQIKTSIRDSSRRAGPGHQR
jgi:hypothetical protein